MRGVCAFVLRRVITAPGATADACYGTPTQDTVFACTPASASSVAINLPWLGTLTEALALPVPV